MKLSGIAGLLALAMVGVQTQAPAGQGAAAQQAIPDAPTPQSGLPDLKSVTPGQGTTSSSSGDGEAAEDPAIPAAAPAATPATGAQTAAASGSDAYVPPPGQGENAIKTLMVHVDAVDVAFTVKNSKGVLVPGLEPRNVQIYENGLRQHIDLFTNEAAPLSVVIVVDQSMSQDDMDRVNDSMGALQDAFAASDEIAVFTYNKSPKMVTDFTGAQSPRLAQAIEQSKGSGREAMLAGSLGGPLSQTTVINNQNFDPNTAAVRGHTGIQLNAPREIHPLNDAILAAATLLSNREIGRRRVVYVISDGNEYGSQAKSSQVIKYLLRNGIEVDGTLVGTSSVPVLGLLDHVHLPLMMRDNVLPAYAKATGGNFDSEFRTGAIEKSFAKIAEEVRTRYRVIYTTHEPFLDGKYRTLEVRVMPYPNLTVIAKPGYWPGAVEIRRTPRPPAATTTPTPIP